MKFRVKFLNGESGILSKTTRRLDKRQNMRKNCLYYVHTFLILNEQITQYFRYLYKTLLLRRFIRQILDEHNHNLPPVPGRGCVLSLQSQAICHCQIAAAWSGSASACRAAGRRRPAGAAGWTTRLSRTWQARC